MKPWQSKPQQKSLIGVCIVEFNYGIWITRFRRFFYVWDLWNKKQNWRCMKQFVLNATVEFKTVWKLAISAWQKLSICFMWSWSVFCLAPVLLLSLLGSFWVFSNGRLGWYVDRRCLCHHLFGLGRIYHFVDMAMTNALAHFVAFILASWGRCKKRLPRSRVLQYCVDYPQPIWAPSTDVYVADKQCPVLP